jgi:5'-nucleotidase
VRVLLTNDDGIRAPGLRALRRALLAVPGVELAVVAPDVNRSAVGQGLTAGRTLNAEPFAFDDGGHGHAVDGTPADCVRVAHLGLLGDFEPQLVVSGINHGANLGEDIVYSGTVAGALEGLVFGCRAIAVSQQSGDPRRLAEPDFAVAGAFVAGLLGRLRECAPPAGTLLNVNVPAARPTGVAVTEPARMLSPDAIFQGPRHHPAAELVAYRDGPVLSDEDGTDAHALRNDRIAVTPIRVRLHDRDAVDAVAAIGLDAVLGDALMASPPTVPRADSRALDGAR